MASWFGAWGLQSVIFSWLVVGELRAEPEMVGLAQTSTMLPALALLLVGGATADRRDPRHLLVWLHALAALPVLLLAASLVAGSLSFAALIAYGIAIGTVQAFVMPARDTLLSRVAGDDMMRAVSGMTAAQFGAQAAGTLIGGAARWLSSPGMLLIQAVLLLLGAKLTQRISAGPAREVQSESGARAAWHDIQEGLQEVVGNPRLRGPLTLVLAVGLFFIGPFMVLFPLLVRDFYDGGVVRLSLVLALFPIGTITGSLVLRRLGLQRKGRAALLSLIGGATALAVVGSGIPFPALVASTFAWGLCGSVFINSSRTIYQEAAPAEHRARVMSIYQLGFMGAAPVGTLSAGFTSGVIGPLATLQLCGLLMLGVVAWVWLTTQVPRME